MKNVLITCVILLTMFSSVIAQSDWTARTADLYYHNGDEAVYIQASAKTAAIYFQSSVSVQPSSRLRSAYPNARISQEKSMMIIDGVRESLATEEERQAFMQRYALSSQGATQVLPGFQVDENLVWFTTHLTVRVAKNSSVRKLQFIANNYGAEVIENVGGDIYILGLGKIQQQLPLIQELHDQGVIKWGQPDFIATVQHTNDPLYGAQFQMHNTGSVIDGVATTADIDLDAPEAWTITKGSSSIRVSVVDDGLESHEDLPSIIGGYTPLNNGNGTPNSDGAHGVSCAGIIAATHDNGIGVKGMAPNVQLQTVNIFAGNESINDLAAAFTWSVNNGADVISNSWGFPNLCQNNPYPALTDAINSAAVNGRNGKGCVIIFAAGNDGNTCVSYPGRLASVVAVGAIGANGVPSYYTNSGSTIDVVAPSSDQTWGVRTTDREGSSGYGSGNYTNTFGGTSAACPAVAGAAALVLSVNGDLTGPQVHDLLEQTADDMGSSGFDNTYGYGRVNAYEAVIAAQGGSGGGGGGGGSSCDDIEATLTIIADNYPGETTWAITDDSGATVASGGPYSTAGATYTEDICLPDGCYTFTINDSYGDGICCSYGSGSYALTSGGSTLASGGAFASSESTDFDLGAGCGGGGGGGGGGGCTNVTIDSNNFDSGWGIWNDGGSDCRRSANDAAYANSGSYCVRLRDNSGVASSMTTDVLNLAGFEEVVVDFSFLPVSMETGEDFWLQASTDGGSTYQTLTTWASGTDFSNNVRQNPSITITGTFTSTVTFRFTCDASANADRIYIDDVVLSGCTTAGNLVTGDDFVALAQTEQIPTTVPSTKQNELKLFPNPSSDKVNVNLTLENPAASATQVYVMDVMGRVVYTTTLEGSELSQFTLDVTNFAQGFYHMSVVNADERLTKTFVVSK